MDPKDLFKQMFDFNKTAYENGYKTMDMLLEQADTMIKLFVEQNPILPEEYKKAAAEWSASCGKSRHEFKKTVDEGFSKIAKLFVR